MAASAEKKPSSRSTAEYLTTRQLQEILHVDRTTIYRMADGGRVPAVKVGSQWRFPRRAIEHWLTTQSEASVAADAGPAAPLGAGGNMMNTALTGTAAHGAVGSVASSVAGLGMDKLLPVECVQKIQDAFADLLGVTLVVTSLAGEPLLAYSNLNSLLRLVLQSAAGRRLLAEDWADLAASPSVMPAFVRGRIGLEHTRGLVRVGSEIKAMVVAAGIAPEQWPPYAEETAQLAALLHADPGEVRQQCEDLRPLQAAERQHLTVHVQRVADIIAHIISERNLLFTRLQHIADLSQI
jgi:excisionase family DNA binding protein